jgi:hypothetical protein
VDKLICFASRSSPVRSRLAPLAKGLETSKVTPRRAASHAFGDLEPVPVVGNRVLREAPGRGARHSVTDANAADPGADRCDIAGERPLLASTAVAAVAVAVVAVAVIG